MRWDQIYLLIFSILFTLSFQIKTIVQRKRTGIDPYCLSKSTSAQQRFLNRYANAVSAGWGIAIWGYALNQPLMEAIGFPLFFNWPTLHVSGLFLSALFLVGLVLAQWQMGNNWRVGIDTEHRTELVTSGFFRHVRNPVFTMILGGLGAVFLALPGSLTMFLWLMSFSGLYLQVLTEEEFLLQQHQEKYEKYKKQTGRFFPRFPGFKE